MVASVWGRSAPGVRSGSSGTRDRGSVDHLATFGSAAGRTSSPARNTTRCAGAPMPIVPIPRSVRPAERCPPLVCAVNADRGLSSRLPEIEKAVATGTLSPAVAVDEIAQALSVRRP